ncbi:MAG: bifunctional nuclease family protein [Halobacteriaceae archaeon]
MEANIEAIRVAGTPDGPVPVVLLQPENKENVLPIFIGFDEAISIARGLDAVDIGRPLTHDLLLDVIEELGSRVSKIVISAVEDNTFIADLHLNTPRDTITIDARPSDSLALAARTNADIEITESVYEQSQRDPSEFEDLEDIREVTQL